MTISIHLLVALSLFGGANAFLTRAFSSATSLRARFVVEATVGTIFGTSSGSTEEVADMIVEALKDVAATPLNIDDVTGNLAETLAQFDCLVVGAPTYNTDADKQRSATAWDGVYYDELASVAASGALKGKHVAVFGLGDQEGYAENFAEACGELHDVFEAAGCNMFGYTSAVDGTYEHESSKAQRGDLFVALVCDSANQADLSEGRVSKWVAQLKKEGFLKGVAPAAEVAAEVAPAPAEPAAAAEAKPLEPDGQCIGTKTWLSAPEAECLVEGGEAGGFVPFYSPTMKQTLWLNSKDHRLSYEFDKK